MDLRFQCLASWISEFSYAGGLLKKVLYMLPHEYACVDTYPWLWIHRGNESPWFSSERRTGFWKMLNFARYHSEPVEPLLWTVFNSVRGNWPIRWRGEYKDRAGCYSSPILQKFWFSCEIYWITRQDVMSWLLPSLSGHLYLLLPDPSLCLKSKVLASWSCLRRIQSSYR